MTSSNAFDPLGFLDVARALAGKQAPTQSELRTALSRAYYAVFLRARERLIARGRMHTSGTGEDHYLVISTLRSTGVPHGDQLDRLRVKRASADYDLNAQISQNEATQAVALAAYVFPRL